MQLITLFAALGTVTITLATPSWPNWNVPAPSWPNWNGKTCLTQAAVDKLVTGYTYLLEHPGGPDFNSTARAILSDKFFVDSDSINFLSQRPLGQPAYPSREVFIATQNITPPLPVVQTLETFYTCDKISWRWNASGIGSNQYPVRGMITINVNPATTQIDALYSEFNTLAFSADLGYPECQKK